MLLVIFGAGASYDSAPDIPPPNPRPSVGDLRSHDYDRPPLADQLFENRPKFVEVMDQFGTCKPIVFLLRKPGVLVEQELARLHGQMRADPERAKQLAAIRYYLHVALGKCQERWHGHHKGMTNYATLLDEIEHWRLDSKEKVCFVTL